MGRHCTDCPPTEVLCDEMPPITDFVESDWDVEIQLHSDPLTSVSINWGSPLEITCTIGTTQTGNVFQDASLDRGATVRLRHRTWRHRHYKWQTPLTLFAQRADCELATTPVATLGRQLTLFPLVRDAKSLVSILGPSSQWAALYQERLIRRHNFGLVDPWPPCPPLSRDYDAGFGINFPGHLCQIGQSWTWKCHSLEWQIGSNCAGYAVPSPGSDALSGELVIDGLTNGIWAVPTITWDGTQCVQSNPECGDCELWMPMTFRGSTPANGSSLPLTNFRNVLTHCGPDQFSGLLDTALEWDSDLGQWVAHWRGRHYLSGKTDKLAAGSVALTKSAIEWIGGGVMAVPAQCGGGFQCVVSDKCNNFPASINVSLT